MSVDTTTPDTPPLSANSPTPGLTGRTACVVGAGIGGLALAVRLQSAGIATTVVEARDKPGGHAYFWERDGFTFDAGPTVIADPDCLRALWALSGQDMAQDVDLLPVSPFYRLMWPDGSQFDYSNDEEAMLRQIAQINPADVAGYQRFLDYAATVYEEAYVKRGDTPFLDLRSMLRAVPPLARHQAWRSLHSIASEYIDNERLREALSFNTLMVGGNPMTATALYALIHKMEQDKGVWWAKGGMNRLVAGMVALFERLGGTMRLHDPVVRVHTLGTRATEVESRSGWRQRFDAVASNADLMHSYRDLLGGTKRSGDYATTLARKRFSPSYFIVHFGVDGTWPGVPHHTVLFGPRFEGLLTDIYDHGVLPADMAIYLHHPTVTDPTLAPEGKSSFYALVPVANLGKLAVDWEEMGPVLERRVIDEIERRLIPGLHDRIVTSFHYTPRDVAMDLNAHLGNGYSLEPLLSQSAWLRGHNRDDIIDNFYLVGAGTHPGAGIPAVVASAKATAALMTEDLAK